MEHRKNLHSAPREYRSYGAPSSPANCGGCRLRRAVIWVIQTVQHDENDVPIKNQYLIFRIYLPGGSKLQPPFRLLFLLRRRYGGGSGCNFGSGFSGAAPNPPEKWTMCLTRGGADVVVDDGEAVPPMLFSSLLISALIARRPPRAKCRPDTPDDAGFFSLLLLPFAEDGNRTAAANGSDNREEMLTTGDCAANISQQLNLNEERSLLIAN
ncbi:hypothetical protein ACLOJK_009116 [Asimina triloba]